MLWGSYGLVHIITLIISACIIVGLYFILRNRSEKTKVAVLFILSLSGIAAIIFNLVTWGTPLEYLPFHMCSITALILPIAILTRSKIFSNLLLFWCLGAAMAIICNQGQANYVIPSSTFFFYYIPIPLSKLARDEISLPPLMISPLSAFSKPIRIRKSVVLPQPEGPKIERNSPSIRSKLTLFKTVLPAYVLVRFFTDNFLFNTSILTAASLSPHNPEYLSYLHKVYLWDNSQYNLPDPRKLFRGRNTLYRT